MAEATFRQMIATFIRQTRPQSFRHGKPLRYPQRSIATAAAARSQPATEQRQSEWTSHPLTPTDSLNAVSKSRLEQLRAEQEPRQFSSFLTDDFARQHNYLRISLTERCNLRCLYCMPEEGIQLSPPDHILTTPEIVYLSSLFVDQGVNKIRLTGGEPTVRKDILDLMRQIGQLRSNGLKELCITTNGISLHRKLDSMLDSGLTGVNLSLDTLDPFQFTIMTRRNGHDAVMKSINRILEMNKLGAGIKLKINCVVMRGLNDKEIIPFVELGKDKDLEVRFIEYMPFDGNKWSQNKMLSFQEMLAMIRKRYPDVQKVQDHANDTSKTYKVPGFAGRIGFITSMTHNFCGTCNRLRITSDGNLKVCLFGNSEVSLRDILRESNDGNPIDLEAMEAIKQLESTRREALRGTNGTFDFTEREAKLLDVIGVAVKNKKEKHAGMGELENMKNRPMILIDYTTCAQSTYSAYRMQPPLRSSSPLLNVRSTSAFSNSIPFHLLSHNLQPSLVQQQRYRSTFLLRRTYITRERLVRYVFNASTHRRMPIPDPEVHDPTKESWQRSMRVKKSLFERFKGVRSGAPFGTSSSVRDSDQSASSEKPSLSHLTSSGEAHMINIGDKNETRRSATAVSHLLFSKPTTYDALINAALTKGDALAVARVAGIQAAKKTADLIPLAHPSLGIMAAKIDIEPFPSNIEEWSAWEDAQNQGNSNVPLPTVPYKSDFGGVQVVATVQCHGRTGVEMEALTGANIAVLTVYDMLKAIDKTMLITGSRVLEKKGGKSGSWRWDRQSRSVEQFDDSSLSTPASKQQSKPQPTSSTPHPQTSQHEALLQPTNMEGEQSSLPSPSASTSKRRPWPPPSSSLSASATALSSTTSPSHQPDPDTDIDTNPQSILEAEWQSLAQSFSSPSPFFPSNNTDPPQSPTPSPPSAPRKEPLYTRSQYSGVAASSVDAEDIHNARVRRYMDWQKSR